MDDSQSTQERGGRPLFWVVALLAAMAAGGAAIWLLRRYKGIIKRWDCDCSCDCCTGDEEEGYAGTTGLGKTTGLAGEEEAWDRDSGVV